MSLSILQQNKHRVGELYRVSIFIYILYIMVFFILTRVFFLQIIHGNYYQSRAKGNTERVFVTIPPRGLIYDRNGVLVAKNKAAYSLSLQGGYVPRDSNTREKIFQDITQHFDLSLSFLKHKYESNRRNYRQVMIKESLTMPEIIYLSEHRAVYPFLSITEYSGRIYPFKEGLSHVLGYIGAISKRQYSKIKTDHYNLDDIVGKTGLEEEYDKILRGEEGQEVNIVDALGRKVSEVSDKNLKAVPGKNLRLSIDSNLQEIAHHALKDRKGAVIVTKVSTGEVLALVSSPGYNANEFINVSSHNGKFAALLKDKDKPFLNRALQGRYSPGSIFKIVIALSALEDGKLDPYKVEDTSLGYFKLGRQVFRNYGVERRADLPAALEHSNNVYFYRLGYNLGYASILEHSIDLGLKSRTGIDLPREYTNFIPTPEWKEKRFGTVWMDGDTVNISIGQGYLLFTPIGIHNIISTIATGRLIKPRIVWEITNPYSGTLEKKFEPSLIGNYRPKASTLKPIREGLMRVPYTGTARWHQYLSKVKIAGKTGTAQKTTGKDNALFTSYGPVDKPVSEQYAITVLAESSGFGAGNVPISSVLYNYLENAQTKEQAIATLDRVLPTLQAKRAQD